LRPASLGPRFRSVAGDDADDSAFEAALDERLMDAIDETLFGEFPEGPGERGLGRDFAPLPSADAPQGAVDEEAFEEGLCRGEAEGDGAPVFPRPPASSRLGADVEASRKLYGNGGDF
jgi:hypothetical protein